MKGRGAGYKERDSVVGLIRRIRSYNLFKGVPIVAIIEAAPAISASQISRHIEEARLPDVVVMSERRGYVEGVPKNDVITYDLLVELVRVMTPGTLAYWNQLITIKKNVEKVKASFESMMSNLRAVPLNPNQENGDKRYKITAKIGSSPDDMLVAAMMCLYWRGVFWKDRSGKYSEWKAVIRSRNNISFPL